MKSGQAGLSGAKLGKIGPNGDKTGSNRAKWGQKGSTGTNEAKWGHMGLIFCIHANFYETKKSCLATPALRQKLAKLWG